jgi:sigma-E factor negative regulatory protein RseC
MKSVGYVIRTDEHGTEVVLGAHHECKHCGACLASIDATQRRVKAVNKIGASKGQRVEIEIKPRHAVAAAFLIFVVPVVAAIGCGILGSHVAETLGLRRDLGGIGLGSAGLVGSFLLLRYVERVNSRVGIATIVKLITDEDSAEGGA